MYVSWAIPNRRRVRFGQQDMMCQPLVQPIALQSAVGRWTSSRIAWELVRNAEPQAGPCLQPVQSESASE